MNSPRTLCLIAARNLGDITIVSTYFRQLVAQGLAERYVVWTRPTMAFLFEDLPNCSIVTSSFPVGTNRNFGFRGFLGLLRAAMRVRRERPTWAVDYVGDFRERLFARLIGVQRHFQIGWAPEHGHSRIIRNPFGHGHPFFVAPCQMPNVYAAYQSFNDRLLAWRGLPATGPAGERASVRTTDAPVVVGLHPLASQACKEWPQTSWVALALRLLNAQIEVRAFSAPNERSRLQAIFGQLDGRVKLVTGSIPELAEQLRDLDVLVGLDSFSVHLAEHVGRPSILLLGPNPPDMFSPPSASVISSSGGCPAWPCFNVPSCLGGGNEYACMRSISVDAVSAAVATRIESARQISLPHLRKA